MKKYKKIIILVNLIVLLGFFNDSVFQKEKLLSEGQLILLELAPVDPRSLMQGDYMRLRYAISDNLISSEVAKRGFCIVKLEDGIAKKVRLQKESTPVGESEFLIKYTAKKRRGINIGTASFFFQEGEGEKYEKAKYGGVKVDSQGNSLLIGLYDENQVKIE